MATRSAIGFVEYDGSITAVYCHWDGYLEGVGKTLVEHYNDTYKVLDLLEQGDISSLGEEIGEKHPFSCFGSDLSDEQYDKLFGRMTTFYSRDRGENCPAKDFADATAFRSNYTDCDFFYLYDGNEWTYAERGRPYFKPLPILIEA
jgi:hypothetical protein